MAAVKQIPTCLTIGYGAQTLHRGTICGILLYVSLHGQKMFEDLTAPTPLEVMACLDLISDKRDEEYAVLIGGRIIGFEIEYVPTMRNVQGDGLLPDTSKIDETTPREAYAKVIKHDDNGDVSVQKHLVTCEVNQPRSLDFVRIEDYKRILFDSSLELQETDRGNLLKEFLMTLADAALSAEEFRKS